MKNIQYLLLSIMMLSCFSVSAFAYYQPDEGRWVSRNPIKEYRFDVSLNPKVNFPDPDLMTSLNDYGALDNDMVNEWDLLGLLFGFGKPSWRKCPKGQEWTWKNIIRVPKADGCSNPFKGWILGTAGKGIAKIFPGIPDYSGDPDAPWDGVSFSGACNFHDYCYSNCEKSQKECDKGLRDRAKSACTDASAAKSFPSPKARSKWMGKCNAWANAYYTAVKKAGGSAYKNRQNKACECAKCPDERSDFYKRFGVFDGTDHYYPYGEL